VLLARSCSSNSAAVLMQTGLLGIALLAGACASDRRARVEGAVVVEVGLFGHEHLTPPSLAPPPDAALGIASTVDRPYLVTSGSIIPMRIGLGFGMRVRIQGAPPEELIDAQVEVTHPPLTDSSTGATTTVDRWGWRVPIGVPLYTGWGFDEPWQMAPGTWLVRVFYGDSVLAEHTFQVVQG